MKHVKCPMLVLMTMLLLGAAGQDTTASTVTITSDGPMAQLNAGGLPDSTVREFSTIWEQGNSNVGTMFYVHDASSPYAVYKATTTDGGLTWTAGTATGLYNPHSSPQPSGDVRNPVVRDFNLDGNLVGLFGTKQGVYGGGYGANDMLFRAGSGDGGTTWLAEAMTTFNTGAFPGHTGINGFIEVFETSTGILRGYTAMNNATSGNYTHRVESSDGGLTWTDMGDISIPGPGPAVRNNLVGANGPVFWFTDTNDGHRKMGWLVFGETSNNRGVKFMVSTDEGLSWTDPGGFTPIQDNAILSGDADYISDTEVRLFYHKSDHSLWYQDFSLSGMSNIVANNLYFSGAGPAVVPEPISMIFFGTGLVGVLGYVARKRMRKAQEAL